MKFETIIALRGLAAIIIALFHFSGGWAGYLAVEFFLVLCGFVLSHAYLYGSFAATPMQFITRRLVRLYPMHIFTLVSFAAVFFLSEQYLPPANDGRLFTFGQQITLTHNIGLNPHGLAWNRPGWFVSVIFWVNLFFFFFIKKHTKSSSIFIVSVLGFLLIYFNTGHLDVTAGNYYGVINSGLIRGFSSFLLGIISYRIYLHFHTNAWIQRHCTILELCSVVTICLVVFCRSSKYSAIDFLAPFLFMLVLPLFSMEQGILSRHLRRYQVLGEISFSLYLNQTTILLITALLLDRINTHRLFDLAVYLILLTGYSYVTHFYLDKKLIKVPFISRSLS